MIQFPLWLTVLMGFCYAMAQLATAGFVLFVLWPSIRNGDRRGKRIEDWVDSEQGQKIVKKIVDRVERGDGLESAGKPTTRNSFASEKPRGANERDDL